LFVECVKPSIEKIKICETLTRPVATYGVESWSLNKDVAKRLAAFKKVSRRMFRGIKVNEYWRKRCNEELKQRFGDLDTLSFVRTSQLNCVGHVNRMDSTRKVSQVFRYTFICQNKSAELRWSC
jgi:hypothetical protein